MYTNNSDQNYRGGTYYAEPRWDDFTIEDEKMAKSRFSRFSLALFIYMLAASVIILAAQFVMIFNMGEQADEIFNSYWFVWVANFVSMYAIAFPILYLIVAKMRKTVRVKSTLKFSEFIKLLFVSAAFMSVGNFAGNSLSTVIEIFTGRALENSTSKLIEESPLWIIFIVVVIIGPIVEEFIFRKLLMDRLGVYGDRIAIIFSAIAFGIFHGNIYQLFYATLLGLILAYVYSKTSNVLYPILMHMIINFCGSIIPLLLLDKFNRFYELYDIFMAGGEYSEQEFSNLYLIIGAYSFISCAFVITGIVIFFKNRKRIFVSDRCEVLIPKQKRGSVIVGNAGAILFIVLMGLMTLIDMVTGLIPQ